MAQRGYQTLLARYTWLTNWVKKAEIESARASDVVETIKDQELRGWILQLMAEEKVSPFFYVSRFLFLNFSFCRLFCRAFRTFALPRKRRRKKPLSWVWQQALGRKRWPEPVMKHAQPLMTVDRLLVTTIPMKTRRFLQKYGHLPRRRSKLMLERVWVKPYSLISSVRLIFGPFLYLVDQLTWSSQISSRCVGQNWVLFSKCHREANGFQPGPFGGRGETSFRLGQTMGAWSASERGTRKSSTQIVAALTSAESSGSGNPEEIQWQTWWNWPKNRWDWDWLGWIEGGAKRLAESDYGRDYESHGLNKLYLLKGPLRSLFNSRFLFMK